VNGFGITDPLLTHFPVGVDIIGRLSILNKKGMGHKPMPFSQLCFTAGDRIRTDDVQLGNRPPSSLKRVNNATNAVYKLQVLQVLLLFASVCTCLRG
jgi:hypothetical protein